MGRKDAQPDPGPERDTWIRFGYSQRERKVAMWFEPSCTELIFEPDEARAVAAQLITYARLAEGQVH